MKKNPVYNNLNEVYIIIYEKLYFKDFLRLNQDNIILVPIPNI